MYDTGAEYSVFGGWVAPAVGLVLLDGEPIDLTATAGPPIQARFHHVQIVHDSMGQFDIRVAFTVDPIRGNLLGRDFLNLVQIGFRERQLAIYVTPAP